MMGTRSRTKSKVKEEQVKEEEMNQNFHSPKKNPFPKKSLYPKLSALSFEDQNFPENMYNEFRNCDFDVA